MPSMIVLNAKRTRKLPGVRSPKPVEVRARRAIDSLMAPMLADVAARLVGLDSMTNIADVILALREVQEVWERAFSWKAEGLAGRWALDVDVIAKEKLGPGRGQGPRHRHGHDSGRPGRRRVGALARWKPQT